jgi:hypothetical protein
MKFLVAALVAAAMFINLDAAEAARGQTSKLKSNGEVVDFDGE